MGCCSSANAGELGDKALSTASRAPSAPGGKFEADAASVATTAPSITTPTAACGEKTSGDETTPCANSSPVDNAGAEEEEGLHVESQASHQAAAERSLQTCAEHLANEDVVRAERALMQCLTTLEQEVDEKDLASDATVMFMRASTEYSRTLKHLQVMEAAVEHALGEAGTGASEGGWKQAAEMRFDYEANRVQVTEEAKSAIHPDDGTFLIEYRVRGTQIDFRLAGTWIGKQPHDVSVLQVAFAFFQEIQLWHTWHPTVMNDGPTELIPRGKYHNLFQVNTSLVFMKESCVLDDRRFFLTEKAATVDLQVCYGPEHPIYKDYPPVPGCSLPRMGFTCTDIITTHEHSGYRVIFANFECGKALPHFLVRLIAKWLVPEMVRRQMCLVAQTLRDASPHYQCVKEDKTGIYGECEEFVLAAVERAKTRGRASQGGHKAFCRHRVPKPSDIYGRAGSLTVFEARLSQLAATAATEADHAAGGRREADVLNVA